MKRYFSHYTYIYPDIFLKNHVVEADETDRIIRVFPFEKEIEKTEFYSGLLAFLPQGMNYDRDILLPVLKKGEFSAEPVSFSSDISYLLYHEEVF